MIIQQHEIFFDLYRLSIYFNKNIKQKITMVNTTLYNKVMRYLAYLDFFSSKATFKYKNKDYFSTSFGSIISIALIILCIIFTVANQSLWQNDFLYSSIDESRKLNQFSIQSSDLNLAITFLNYQSAVIQNIFKIEYYCYDFTQSTPIQLNLNKNCPYGQYCLSSDQSCPFYFHQNYNSDQIVILIRACNIQADPTCNINQFMQKYNNTTFQLAINYSQWVPDISKNKLKVIAASQIISLTVSSKIVTFSMPLNKIQYNQNYNIIPGLISYEKSMQKTYYDSSNRIIKSSQTKLLANNIIGNISVVPQGTIIKIEYVPADYTQIIIYFTSFLGTLAFIFSICIPNYTINRFYWEIGSNIKYSVDKQNKILDPEQFSFKTFLICFFFYKPLQKMWIWFMKTFDVDSLETRLPLIKYGDKLLNITSLLKRLIKLSKQGNLTKSNIKLTFSPQQQEQYNFNEEYKQLTEYVLPRTDTTEIQKNAFLKLVKINKITFDEAKTIYEMLFPEKYKLVQFESNNQTQKLFKEYQKFLELEQKIMNNKLLQKLGYDAKKSAKNIENGDSSSKREQSFMEANSLNYITSSGALPYEGKNTQINNKQKMLQSKQNIFEQSNLKYKRSKFYKKKSSNLVTNLDKQIEMDEINSEIHL